jgi:hypothetical protein
MDTSKLILGLLVVGSVGLLAATVAGQEAKASGDGAKPGDVISSGTAQGNDGNEYQWRVIRSFPGAEQPFSGQAKVAGFGTFDASTTVAMADNAGAARDGILEYLSGLA